MEQPKNSIKITFNIIFILFSFILVLAFMPNDFGSFNKDLNFWLSVIAVINIFVFWATIGGFVSSWMRYDTLFLLGYLIVHFQIPFLASIGIEPERPSFIWINKMVVNYATWLSTMALLLWLFGFLLFANRKKAVNDSVNYKVNSDKIDWLLVILFLSFVGLVGKQFLGGSYDGGSNWGTGANYAYMLLRITLFLKIIYFFINSSDTKINSKNLIGIAIKNKVFVVVLILYILIFLLAGDRGPVMQVAIIMIAGYSIYQKKIPLHMFIGMILIGAITFTIISFGRTRDASGRESNILVQGYSNMQSSERSFNPTNELASSNRILYRALDVVPDYHPYLNGITIVSEIVGVIPFGGSTFLQVTNLPEMYMSSSYFFTILGQGEFFTFGEGSEILADIYINLGMYGVLVVMFLFGYFISYISFNAYHRDHLKIIVYLLMITGAIYVNRSHVLDALKIVAYALVIDKFLTQRFFIKNG